MAWRIKVQGIESCSCKMVCRCNFGPAEPDQGWCSAVLAWNVLEGDSEGVALSGVTFALVADLPGDFLGGIDVARLYIDEDASEEQRREIEAILHGERGGLWGGMREAIAKWLPTKTASISFESGDAPKVSIQGVGEVTLQPMMTESGRRAALENAPVPEAFGVQRTELAMANGSKMNDPEMRAWESLGYGAESIAEWSG